MKSNEVSTRELELYLKQYGKKGSNIVSLLGKLLPAIEANFSTEVGREIMLEDFKRIEELFYLVYKEEISKQELAEFRYLRDIRIPRIMEKLRVYLAKTSELKASITK